MKLVIFTLFCLIATISSTFDEGSTSRLRRNLSPDSYVRIPDRFSGMKFVLPEEEPEISPSFVPADDMVFLLFTRVNPTTPQILQFNDMSSVTSSHFSSARPTKLICHGWQSDANTLVNPLVTAAYLEQADVNVIVVDWSVGAGSINYITSRNRVGPTGQHVALFLNNLNAGGLLPDFGQVSCAGQSLGAHVCGFTGKNTNGRLNTIFGLDPAGPLFSVGDPANRLDAADAEYVENVHTDTANLGIGDPIGHADFYPNGGTGMPGCLTTVCDHAIAANYFAESVNSDMLWGRQCADLDAMLADNCTGDGFSMGGFPSNHGITLRGIFRMPTNAASPFGVGRF